MDEKFILTVRSMFERIMKETRTILANMESRYALFMAQQIQFVEALQRIRGSDKTAKVKSIAEVYDHVHLHSEHRGDTRICKIFLGLVKDLDEFRRTLERLAVPTKDANLEYMFATWKKILDHTQDISHLRERKPYSHLNQLGIDEARLYIGGIVSVLPVAMDCAQSAYKRLNALKAYRIQANEYHYIEGMKADKHREEEERYYAEKFHKLCAKEECSSPLPQRFGDDLPKKSKKETCLPNKDANKKVQVEEKGRQSKASKADVVVGTKLQAFSRPASTDQRSMISSGTASTRSTESHVMSHIKTKMLDPRVMLSHGYDKRPRGENVARVFQWYAVKHVDEISNAGNKSKNFKK